MATYPHMRSQAASNASASGCAVPRAGSAHLPAGGDEHRAPGRQVEPRPRVAASWYGGPACGAVPGEELVPVLVAEQASRPKAGRAPQIPCRIAHAQVVHIEQPPATRQTSQLAQVPVAVDEAGMPSAHLPELTQQSLPQRPQHRRQRRGPLQGPLNAEGAAVLRQPRRRGGPVQAGQVRTDARPRQRVGPIRVEHRHQGPQGHRPAVIRKAPHRGRQRGHQPRV